MSPLPPTTPPPKAISPRVLASARKPSSLPRSISKSRILTNSATSPNLHDASPAVERHAFALPPTSTVGHISPHGSNGEHPRLRGSPVAQRLTPSKSGQLTPSKHSLLDRTPSKGSLLRPTAKVDPGAIATRSKIDPALAASDAPAAPPQAAESAQGEPQPPPQPPPPPPPPPPRPSQALRQRQLPRTQSTESIWKAQLAFVARALPSIRPPPPREAPAALSYENDSREQSAAPQEEQHASAPVSAAAKSKPKKAVSGWLRKVNVFRHLRVYG